MRTEERRKGSSVRTDRRGSRKTEKKSFFKEIEFIIFGLVAGLVIGFFFENLLLGAAIGMLLGVVISEFLK